MHDGSLQPNPSPESRLLWVKLTDQYETVSVTAKCRRVVVSYRQFHSYLFVAASCPIFQRYATSRRKARRLLRSGEEFVSILYWSRPLLVLEPIRWPVRELRNRGWCRSWWRWCWWRQCIPTALYSLGEQTAMIAARPKPRRRNSGRIPDHPNQQMFEGIPGCR